MARFTDTYKLWSADFGETILPEEDSRRFLTVDRQLLGLFEVFGNGVIQGWNVTHSGGLNVSVSAGRGHVSFLSAVTTEPATVTDLTPDSTNFIYAVSNEQTRFDRNVDFIATTTRLSQSLAVLLAAVTTDASLVTAIDTTVRQDISFIETIKALINAHRHRGGLDSPSKINLASEVTGQLPGFRIGDVDASKVTSGLLSPGRLPRLSHSDLEDAGVLTHAQLDSFVRDLSAPNVRLLGELSAVNMLQLYLAMKHAWNEVDAFATNQIAMIPGITPDSQTDLVNTTAVYDRVNHTIQGVPSVGGQLLSTTFDSVPDFNASRSKVNLQVGEDATGAFFRLDKPQTVVVVDSFDNVFATNQDFPDWTVATVASASNTSLKSDSSEKVDGAFSAKLNVEQSFRVQATRFFGEPQDWTQFNELEMFVQTLSPSHGQIRFQVLGGTTTLPTVLDDFLVLSANEITTGFQRVVRDVSTFQRGAVIGIRMYTDTSLGWDLSPVILRLDSIRLNNNLFFRPTGAIRFRIQTPQRSQWAAVSWDAELNGGTVQARARSASSFAVMDQTNSVPFQAFFGTPGEDPGVDDNTNFEVEIALASTEDRTASPVVRSVTVSFVTSSSTTGLVVDTAEEFGRAESLENVTVEAPGEVLIDGRIDAGDYYFGQAHSFQQIDRFGTPVIGATGNRLPLSPLQAGKSEFVLRRPTLDGVASVRRLPDRTYLVCDALNDRVLLLDAEGGLVRGLATNNARNIDDSYPLGASYHDEQKILYVPWSTNVSFSGVDLSKFVISGSGLSVTLSNSIDSVVRIQGQNAELEGGNVIAIQLGTVHASELDSFLESTSVDDARIFLDVEPDAVAEQVDVTNANFATLTGPRGLQIFVGKLQFVGGLFRPVHVSLTGEGNWLVSNAKPLLTVEGADPVTGVGKSEVTSVVEVNPATGELVFSTDAVDFSLLTLGAAVEFASGRYVALAGIATDQSPPATSASTSTVTSSVGGGVQIITTTTTSTTDGETTTTTTSSDLEELAKYRGRLKIVEKSSGRVTFDEETSDGTYAADVVLDDEENLVFVEKSFQDGSSRGRVAKMDDLGNIFFQFGLDELAAPNDTRFLSTGNLVVST